jgi:multidrug efflux pump subunit AcrB
MNEKVSQNSLIAKYLSNPRLVILLLVLIIGIGINSFLTLPRSLNPEVNIPIVLISTVLPGSNPGDVEALVTIPIEDAVRGVDGVKKIDSTSRESVSIVSIEFESGTVPEKARDDVSSVVDSVQLPDDANEPTVQKLNIENQPVWTFALTTKQDNATLFRFAESLQQKLEDLAEVDQVTVSGVESLEVEVTIKPEILSAYKINTQQISQLIRGALSSFPAGSVQVGGSNFSLTIDPVVVQIADIRSLKINISGEVLSLSDIAIISQHPKPNQGKSYLTSTTDPIHRSVTFDVFRTSSSNIDVSVERAEKLVDEEIKKNQGNFETKTLLNTAEQIDHQFSELQRDFLITVTFVVLVLFIFLGVRQAIVSALSAPLSFLIAFIVMKATGISLNFLSLFSLLLSLGLLVDDTVVVISAVTSYYRKYHKSPLQTGLLVWRDFLIPIFTTTITTIWAFLPLLLSTGIIGEFIKSIPIVVSTALIGSFFVSIFIILPLIIFLLQGDLPRRVIFILRLLVFLAIIGVFYLLIPKNNNLILFQILALLIFLFVSVLIRDTLLLRLRRIWGPTKINYREILNNGLISFENINNRYQNLIHKIIISPISRRKTIAAVLIFSIFSFLLLPLGLVQNEFFPKTDEDYLYISLELSPGTHIDTTNKETLLLLDDLKKVENIDFLTADVGRSFSSEGGVGSSGSENVLFSLTLKEDRSKTSGDIAQDLREKFTKYQKGKLSIQEISGGPPAGSDIQIRLLGEDLNQLDAYATKVEEYLKTEGGVNNVSKSIKPGTSKLAFIPDMAEISRNQTSIEQIGLTLRTFASGLNIDSNKFPGDNEDKDITLRFNSKGSLADELDTILLTTPTGNLPLSALGELKLLPNPTLITRQDGKRVISVSAGVSQGFNIAEINKNLENFAESQLNLPAGYTWATGGVNEENNQSVQSIMQAMVLSFFLIIVTMVIQFSSFRRALVVMLVIPLSISGVFVIFALTKIPLSFPALIGVLALFGIVVKNSILIVDKIVQNEKKGMKLAEAISDASASRLEPIALTSLCTIIGLVPITLSDPLWRGLGGAIIAGLTFSGTIMLFFIPVVYYFLFREK